MDELMFVLLAPPPQQNSNKLQWYRYGTGCLMIYGLFLAFFTVSMDSTNIMNVGLDSRPWRPYIEYPLPAISTISSLLFLPVVICPTIEFRNYIIPGIIMNVYMALSVLANGVFTIMTLGQSTWPFQYLIYTSLMVSIHCLLIKLAIAYYILLYPNVFDVSTNNVVQIIEEFDHVADELNVGQIM